MYLVKYMPYHALMVYKACLSLIMKCFACNAIAKISKTLAKRSCIWNCGPFKFDGLVKLSLISEHAWINASHEKLTDVVTDICPRLLII